MPTSPSRASEPEAGPSRQRRVDTTKRTRRRGARKTAARDPLTRILAQIIALPLFLGLILLHVGYYVYIRIRSFTKRQDVLSQSRLARKARQLQGSLSRDDNQQLQLQPWTGRDEESEEALLEMGNARRRLPNLAPETSWLSSVGDKKKGKMVPPMSHFALCLGPKPTRSHVLLARAAGKVAKAVARHLDLLSNDDSSDRRTGQSANIDGDAEQLRFALESTRSALRYCALAAVPELTIYDDRGLLQEALQTGKIDLDASYFVAGYEPADEEASVRASNPPVPDTLQHNRRDASYDDDVASPRTPRSRASSISGGAAGTSSSDDETALTDDSGRGSSEPSSKRNAASFALEPKHNLRIVADVRFPSYDEAASSGAGKSASSYISRARTATIRVNVLSKRDSKEALAHVASHLAREGQGASNGKHQVVAAHDVQRVLEERFRDYPREPDVVVIHGGARHVSTLHGFPPWLVKLCEIVHDVDAQPDAVLSASTFALAMRRYSGAEQRFGK